MREQLGVQFSPYKTYVLELDASEYLPVGNYLAPSVVVSMTFRSELRARDVGSSGLAPPVQNIPQSPDLPVASQYGAAYTSPQTILTPAANAQIVADADATDDGVQGALKKMDASVRGGLIGGYTEMSRRHGFESILNDAAYEIIAVPMWGNGWFIHNGVTSNYPLLPHVGAAFDQQVVDRRVIPLHFPMVIHHVLAFVNYAGGIRPATATYSYAVGVGMGTGIRSDSNGYRQIAYANWTNATHGFSLIDSYARNISSTFDLAGDLMSIPLVGTGGDGFSAVTGKPMYVGKTSNADVVRSSAAAAVGGAPTGIATIDGKEQWLEVRMAFRDSAGIDNMPATQTLVGHGGHWVYIIGKKQVC